MDLVYARVCTLTVLVLNELKFLMKYLVTIYNNLLSLFFLFGFLINIKMKINVNCPKNIKI